MALTNTTLSAACGASDLTLAITSTSSGFPAVATYATPHQLLRIDGEDMLIQVVPVANTVKVMQRGYNGTVAAAHEALAVVSTSSDPADFGANPAGGANSRPPYVEDLVTIGVDTTFTAAGTAATATTLPLPTKNTRYLITKATACAITLISATSAQMGVKLTFQNGRGEDVTYRLNNGAIERHEISKDSSGNITGDSGWRAITAENVMIQYLIFRVPNFNVSPQHPPRITISIDFSLRIRAN